jgi:small subunit ribosomal protein S1
MTSSPELENGYSSIYEDEGWWRSILLEERGASKPAARSPKKKETKNWETAMHWYQRDMSVSLTVHGYNRGGLLLSGEGVSGFLPYSHLVQSFPTRGAREETLSRYVGRRLLVKVIECVPEEGRLVFSERAAQSEDGRRKALLDSLYEGQRIEGVVTNITKFGVFVDLGGMEGLIHISELSWKRITHPKQILRMNERVNVQVLKIFPERYRVSLSLKRLQENPWERAESMYPVGDVFDATITRILPYGAFARLEGGLEGLIHVSELPMARGERITSYLREGQRVQVRVLRVEPERQRLSLRLESK